MAKSIRRTFPNVVNVAIVIIVCHHLKLMVPLMAIMAPSKSAIGGNTNRWKHHCYGATVMVQLALIKIGTTPISRIFKVRIFFQ